MQTQSHKLWLRRLFASTILALTAQGCVHALVGDGDACIEGDAGYAVGETFKSDDGCNTCTCTGNGEAECTLVACADDYDGGAATSDSRDGGSATWRDGGKGESCEYKGKEIAYGQRFTTGNGCEACTCGAYGKLDCSDYACPSDGGAPVCFDGKNTYPVGSFAADDGCNKCSCDKNGTLSCTKNVCNGSAGASTPATCKYNGKEVKGTFLTGDACDTCTCRSDGSLTCTKNACLPDGGAGSCEIQGKTWPVGTSVYTGDGCNTCDCIADGKVACDMRDCSADGGAPTAGDAGPPDVGTCDYLGKTFKVGEGFPGKDGCEKCTCLKPGYFECSGACMTPGCYRGVDLFLSGSQTVCPDGCNTCTCGSGGVWGSTKQACPALPGVSACPSDAAVSLFLAPVAYIDQDAVAVTDSRCVNGQTRDFQLCYDPVPATFNSEGYFLYVYSTGAARTCNAELPQRVFSLLPLRDAYRATHPNTTAGKVLLRSSGRSDTYGFQL